jgi:hypothetical protein
MSETRDKTLSYRRAEWFGPPSGLNLEKCIRDAYDKLKSVNDRSIPSGDRFIRSVKSKDGPTEGLLVHLTVETPGEPASVVPTGAPNISELDLLTAAPPSEGEWLDGDAFLFISDDHICMCGSGIRDGSIRYFLHSLFKKASLRKDSIKFELVKVADISKVKLIQSQGVKELEIRASLYKATASYRKRMNHAAGALGVIGKHLKAVLKKPDDVSPDALRVILTLKTDRRFSKDLKLGEQNIAQLAKDVLINKTEDDDYVIVTKSGQRISPEEIFMRSKVTIKSDGKTVDRDKTWKELVSFFKNMKTAGILEE